MKKIYLFIASVLFVASHSSAQNVLLNQDFNNLGWDTTAIHFLGVDPSTLGNTTDTAWYSYDGDGYTDGHSSGTWGGAWLVSRPFAYADTSTAGGAPNYAMVGDSWFAPAGIASNYLITPSVMLGAHDTLFWKSASYQTPRYLDGYEVLISTSDNSDISFSTLPALFTAAEMININGTNDSVFSGYDFSTPGWIQGLDGTFVEYHNDSARLVGVLAPQMVALDAAGYANQKVFIAFHHNSEDDNLLAVDDIMIRGTLPSGINEQKLDIGLNVFPNPSSETAQINYELHTSSNVTITVFDVTGKLISSLDKGQQLQGRHITALNTAEMAKGFYTIKVSTENGISVTKLIVQ